LAIAGGGGVQTWDLCGQGGTGNTFGGSTGVRIYTGNNGSLKSSNGGNGGSLGGGLTKLYGGGGGGAGGGIPGGIGFNGGTSGNSTTFGGNGGRPYYKLVIT